jgi:signal transduction histidine kinase
LLPFFINRHLDQQLLNEISEYSSLFSLKGFETLKTALVLEAESEGADKIFFRIVKWNGEEIFSSNISTWSNPELDRTVLDQLRNGASHAFETVTIPEHPHKMRILYGVIAGTDKILQIGESLEDNKRLIEIFRKIFGAIIAVLIPLGALVGWFMARRAMAGVEEVTQTAMDISEGAFKHRVSVKHSGDEINRLATTFNVMLDRIDVLVNGMREMSDNIAHDLRSPITRIRGIAEMTLITAKSMDEYKDMAVNTVDECDKLLEMVNTMLDISEVEAGAGKLRMEKSDMSEIVRDACGLFLPAAEEKGLTLIARISNNSFVQGDTQMLQRMVVNFLDNALKYTLHGGTITVSVNTNKGWVVISIKDTGIGISADDLPHIFERFYRCDQSRAQAGIGLGLSFAMAIAKSHGGNITATSYPGNGSEFTIILPQSSLSQ